VCPGDVDTPLVAKQLAEGNYSKEEMAQVYPLGRIGRPEEIAHVICSLLSPLNGFYDRGSHSCGWGPYC